MRVRTDSQAAWLWLLQRATAVLLVGVLALHLWLSNFALAIDGGIRSLVGLILLAAVLLHALNGLRAIALDYATTDYARRFAYAVVLVLGVLGIIFGFYGIAPLFYGG